MIFLCNPFLFHQQTYIFEFNYLKAENQYHAQPSDGFNYPKSNYSSCMKLPSYVQGIVFVFIHCIKMYSHKKMRVKMYFAE